MLVVYPNARRVDIKSVPKMSAVHHMVSLMHIKSDIKMLVGYKSPRLTVT